VSFPVVYSRLRARVNIPSDRIFETNEAVAESGLRMNIGMDACTFRKTPTGIYNYLWNLVDSLGRINHDHTLSLLLYGPGSVGEKHIISALNAAFPHARTEYVWDGWPLFLLSESHPLGGRYSRAITRGFDRMSYRLWRKIHLECPGVVRWSPANLFGAGGLKDFDLFHHTYGLTFPLNRGANVLTIYDLIPRKFPEQYPGALGWFGESFDRAKNMDLILVISENTKNDVIELLNIPEDRIHVTLLAAHEQYRPIEDREKIRALLAKYAIADRPYVLSMGTLEYRRNLHRLLEAVYLLKQERRWLDHRLVLVGTKGESYEMVFDTIRRMGLDNDVIWLGHVRFEDLPVLLNGAELFVYPSLYEGFGLPPLEAMACGTPVVSSRASSLAEVIGDGGVLFDPYDISAMASAIQTVLKDDGLKVTLRKKGIARAAQFSWRRTAETTLGAYEEARARSTDDRLWKRRRRSKTVIQSAFITEFMDGLEEKYIRHS
jgi:glycosyltransferase involved in cell wall biosynthesis